jgi:hypothetical protein
MLPEFITTILPSGLLRVEAFASGRCELIVSGITQQDADKLKLATSLGPSGHIIVRQVTLSSTVGSVEFGQDCRPEKYHIRFSRA